MDKRQVPIDTEMNAVIEFDNSFRFILSQDDLSEYNKGFVNWHKQSTIEISVVYEGAVNVYVPKQKKTVVAGDGFFILPGFLHSIRSAPGYETAKYFTLIFHPEILYGFHGSYYDKAYYRPFIDGNAPLFLFHSHEEWTEEVFPKLRWISDHCSERTPSLRLKIQHILQDVWALFASQVLKEASETSVPHTRKILDLIGYLHEHYAEKFSLTALARSVFMSRNECCRYFKQMMSMTITEYLLEYRLSKAAELLETSGLSITEIAEKTGFCDVSYFIKKFRLKTGMTPKVYARKIRKASESEQNTPSGSQ